MESLLTKRGLNEKLTAHQTQTLDSLIEVLIRPQRLKRDLFIALLLTLMRENDFLQIKTANKPAIDIVDYIFSRRKENTATYDATFLLNKYKDYPIKFLATPLSDIILLNCLIPDTKESFSICLDIKQFILTSNLGIPYSFSNLKELRTVLKTFASPIKNCIFNRYRTKLASLLSVPEAVIIRIVLNLPIRDVLNLSESCKRMNCIVKEDQVWARLYSRDFSNAHKYEGCWLDMYREVYVFRRKRKVPAPDRDYVRYAVSPRWEIIL